MQGGAAGIEELQIGATLEKLPQIEAFEKNYSQRRPWLA